MVLCVSIFFALFAIVGTTLVGFIIKLIFAFIYVYIVSRIIEFNIIKIIKK